MSSNETAGKSTDQVRRADYFVGQMVEQLAAQDQVDLQLIVASLFVTAAALFTRDLRQRPDRLPAYRFALKQLGDELVLASVPPTAQGH